MMQQPGIHGQGNWVGKHMAQQVLVVEDDGGTDCNPEGDVPVVQVTRHFVIIW